ncbi:uncharacterized protein LOC116181221 [Photinus pyralis]|uniref:Uncharacterized protein n=2 Tax=Photinus pyralis TaxID=7054 RepID=A0A1Y1N9U1_PHOPY|nr:uncharacterized protein LOC116181221 [Photinus pyralis]
MEQRVKVHLDSFFTDYRSLCYVYANKNMKTIQDLIHHISSKFDVPSTVYLTSNNIYLPPFEDIRILGDCDSIVVRPLVRNRTSKKKKQKFSDEPSAEVDKSKNCNASVVIDQNKASQRLEHPECMSIDGSEGEDCTDSAIRHKKKKKKEKRTKADDPPEELINLLESTVPNDTTLNRPLNPTIVKRAPSISSTPTCSLSVTNLSKVFRKQISTTPSIEQPKPIRVGEAVVAEFARRKRVDLLPISTAPNIVKSILVSDQDSNLDTNTVYDVSSSSESECSQSKETCEVPETKQRKRKRVRKRKPKPPLTPLPYCPPRSLNGSSSPHLHLRFDNEPEAVESPPAPEEIVENVDKVQIVNYKDLCENEIKNFPIMKGVDPKVDDIIAFKRFMLSENYTPEVSNYIIGSVCSYSPSTSTVVIKVLEGREQCNDPRGKFYMEENENGVQSSTVHQYVWSELIEPRLLFP